MTNNKALDNAFMKFTFKLGDETVHANLSQDLKIDISSPEVIAQQLRDNAELCTYWGSVAERALVLYQDAQTSFDMWYAGKYKETKIKLIEEFGKSSLTESQIKYEIMLVYGEDYKRNLTEVRKAEFRKRVLSVAKIGFERKQEALVNLLSFYKKEKERA